MLDLQIFNSSERAAIPKLDGVNKPGSLGPLTTIIVTGETRPFRFLARNLEFTNLDSTNAIDLGCSTGETTHILAKRFKKVIGIDVSQEPVEKGMLVYQDLDLRVFDVLAERELLAGIIVDELGGKPVFFIDIGGDRMQDIVILFISYLIEKHAPFLIVVKSRKLFKHLSKHCLEEDRIHCSTSKWEKLVAETKENELRERKCFHPQRYALQLVPGTEQPICRYHNYGENGCKKGEECEQDHLHCHHCQVLGHRGRDCEVLAAELIVRKKA